MKKSIVLKVGGSLLFDDDLTARKNQIQNFASTLQKAPNITAVIVGGGKIARTYINAARLLNANESICDILGIDPLYVANEGKVIIIISPDQADDLLEFIKDFEEAKDSRIIGEVNTEYPKKVIMETEIGGTRIVDMPSGELLPRIC